MRRFFLRIDVTFFFFAFTRFTGCDLKDLKHTRAPSPTATDSMAAKSLFLKHTFHALSPTATDSMAAKSLSTGHAALLCLVLDPGCDRKGGVCPSEVACYA